MYILNKTEATFIIPVEPSATLIKTELSDQIVFQIADQVAYRSVFKAQQIFILVF